MLTAKTYKCKCGGGRQCGAEGGSHVGVRRTARGLSLAGVCLALALGGVTGCTHGSDDTGGGSSAGSMSGATDPQGTQAMANRQGPPPGGGPNPPATGTPQSATGTVGDSGISAGGSGTSGGSMGTSSGADAAPGGARPGEPGSAPTPAPAGGH